jgi:hypothetical protein
MDNRSIRRRSIYSARRKISLKNNLLYRNLCIFSCIINQSKLFYEQCPHFSLYYFFIYPPSWYHLFSQLFCRIIFSLAWLKLDREKLPLRKIENVNNGIMFTEVATYRSWYPQFHDMSMSASVFLLISNHHSWIFHNYLWVKGNEKETQPTMFRCIVHRPNKWWKTKSEDEKEKIRNQH